MYGEICSHYKAYQFYARSIRSRDEFKSIKCDKWKDYEQSKCEDSENYTYMGEYANCRYAFWTFEVITTYYLTYYHTYYLCFITQLPNRGFLQTVFFPVDTIIIIIIFICSNYYLFLTHIFYIFFSLSGNYYLSVVWAAVASIVSLHHTNIVKHFYLAWFVCILISI